MELNLNSNRQPEQAAVSEGAAAAAQKAPRRPRRRLTGKERLILLIPAVAAVVAVVIAIATVNRGTSYVFKDNAAQYYAGSIATVQSGARLKYTGDGKCTVKQGGTTQETSLPFYLNGSRKAVLPVDMLHVAPRTAAYSRAVHFTEVECKANGTVSVQRERNSKVAESGFLYDGGDQYIFLEPMIVYFNGYKMELPALSYVEAVYGGYMMVFNYETKECFTELSDGSGTAQPPSGDYVLSLLGDSVTMRDGSKMLLATRPDLFDPIV